MTGACLIFAQGSNYPGAVARIPESQSLHRIPQIKSRSGSLFLTIRLFRAMTMPEKISSGRGRPLYAAAKTGLMAGKRSWGKEKTFYPKIWLVPQDINDGLG